MPGSPLRERVDAPLEVPRPSHPDVAHWRPATTDDVDRIWDLNRSIGEADHPNHVSTREGIAHDLNATYFHRRLDSLLALDRDGALLASGMVVNPPGQETLVRSILVGGVRPDVRGRGLGRQLVAWQIARARQQLAGSPKRLPGWILAYTDERAPQNARLFERAGLSRARYFLSLERMASEPVRSVQLPGEVRVAPFVPGLASEVLTVRNEAFKDHWASQPTDPESWSAFLRSAIFRPDLSFVALAAEPGGGSRVVGFLVATAHEENWERQGFTGSYVDLVGVRTAWRGRHIAQALLSAHLQAVRALRYERVSLTVDSDSPTGALALYTGMGFYPTNRELAFRMEF